MPEGKKLSQRQKKKTYIEKADFGSRPEKCLQNN
jgi:hypothetical protein